MHNCARDGKRRVKKHHRQHISLELRPQIVLGGLNLLHVYLNIVQIITVVLNKQHKLVELCSHNQLFAGFKINAVAKAFHLKRTHILYVNGHLVYFRVKPAIFRVETLVMGASSDMGGRR